MLRDIYWLVEGLLMVVDGLLLVGGRTVNGCLWTFNECCSYDHCCVIGQLVNWWTK